VLNPIKILQCRRKEEYVYKDENIAVNNKQSDIRDTVLKPKPRVTDGPPIATQARCDWIL